MKTIKSFLLGFMLLLASVAQAYDFSAVVPSGQTLYFRYSGSDLIITYPNSMYNNWHLSTKPVGELVIPSTIVVDGITWNIVGIDNLTFKDCTDLTSVTIDANINTIPSSAFMGCTGITTLIIGNSVTQISSAAFYGCNHISHLVCYANNPPSCGDDVFTGVSSNISVNVPCGTSTAYGSDTGWIHFSNITEMPSNYTANVMSNDSAMGLVSINSCNNIITATANNGYYFTHWNDGNNQNPRTIFLTEDTTFTAYFAPYQYSVGVTISGNGTATGDTMAINYLDSITLTATPSTGYTFKGWKKKVNGAWGTSYYSTDNPLLVQVDTHMSFMAVFEKTIHTVTAAVNDTTMGYVTGGGEIEYGTTVTLNANARTGYRFTGWSDGHTSSNRNVYIISDTTFTANFEAIPQYVLSIGVNYADRGSVTGGGIFYEGTTASFSASANTGYYFTGWSDGVMSASRNIVLYADTTISADFDYIDYIVKAQSGNNLRGSAEGTDTVHYGDTVTLTATANDHFTFQHWQKSDGTTHGDNPLTIAVTQNCTFTAIFAAEQHSVAVYSDGGGLVTINNNTNIGNYDYFTQLTIRATANGNNAFLRWADGNTFNPRTVTITQDTTFSAIFLNGTTILHDTIHDTVYFNHYTHDTTYINNYIHDTVRITNHIVDSTVVNLYQYDTTINNYYQFDTVIINNYQHDTTLRYVYDTVYLMRYITDTVVIHDTVYTSEGIGYIDVLNAKIYASNGAIVVEGADGNTVTVFDANGRLIASKRDEYMPLRIPVSASGVYMIKIGNHPTRKVVVIR